MNAIVDIYFDKNIGDDLMGELIIESMTSKGWTCYIPQKDEFLIPDSIKNMDGVKFFKEINKELLEVNKIKCYIKVGGSMFPHGSIIEGIKRFKVLSLIKMMKKRGVKIGIFGCSLGPFISKVGVSATKKIIKLSDVITCRDRESFEFIKKVKPKNSHLYSDIVFGSDIQASRNVRNDIGVSVYTGYAPYLKKFNSSYGSFLVNLLRGYSAGLNDTRIKLFLFDTGYNSDFPIANYIENELKDLDIEIIPYRGDCSSFIKEMNTCKLIIGSRFHSIILSMKLRIPVLPIIYSAKTSNLLDDINYKGIKINIKSCQNVNIDEVIRQINSGNILNDIKIEYERNGKGHLIELNKLLSNC